MYPAAINRPSPPTRVPRVPVTAALTGARPRAGPLPPSAAATPAIPFPPVKGAILPNGVQEPVQRDPNQASHAANN
jgi:hypothetical protein